MVYLSEYCFHDEELIAYVKVSETIGECSFTKNKSIPVVEISNLLNFFETVMSLFEENADSQFSMVQIIQRDWKLFYDEGVANSVLEYVYKSKQGCVAPDAKVVYNKSIYSVCEPWSHLVEYILWKSRYLISVSELLDYGWDSLLGMRVSLDPEDVYYRGRIHYNKDEKPFEKDKMGAPPKEIAVAGRANATGIPCLYLCDKMETVLYEIRATYLDEVSIGKFIQHDKSIKVEIADFTCIPSLFANFLESNMIETVKSKLLTDMISRHLSKPLRRYDSERDYIPTQFICEFIHLVSGVKGIRFESSVHPGFTNLVIFEPTLMECFDVIKTTVTDVRITTDC